LHHNNQLYQYEKYNHTPALAQLIFAEMVLGYIDERLSQCLDENMNYHIIRYRDDYRIFTNNEKEGNTVIGELIEEFTISSE
jgi:hypothetical protein